MLWPACKPSPFLLTDGDHLMNTLPIVLSCSSSNCSLPTCPDCGECVRFCDCR